MAVFRADLANVARITPLFEEYRAFYGQEPSAANARRFLERRIWSKQSVIFYAKHGERIAGFVQLYPLFSSVALRSIWLLNDLFVNPEDRRMGYAKALLERAKQHAVETKAGTLFLETGTNNRAAQALYESLGYVREERFCRYDLSLT